MEHVQLMVMTSRVALFPKWFWYFVRVIDCFHKEVADIAR